MAILQTNDAEDKRKHLEFIQAIISRMSQNSFLIKGWVATLVSALFVLSEKDSDQKFILVAYLPTILFWLLDSYFIYKERLFRDLYEKVRQQVITDFSISIDTLDNGIPDWIKAAMSKTILIFYLPIMIVLLLFMFVLK